jgi:putative spermidine/putrescine transport system permease protein
MTIQTLKRKLLFSTQLIITLCICAFLFVPVLVSATTGFMVSYFKGFSAGLTLRWVTQVITQYHDAIINSLIVAGSTLIIVLLVGVPAGYVLSRWQSRFARFLEELITLPIALPGLASALAIISVYGGERDFRISLWFIIVGHVIFTLPFMIRSVAAACASQNIKLLEEGAASLGAHFLKRFTTIVVPNIHSGILAGALMVVTLSLGEFNLTWMLHTPQTKTLPVGLADAYASLRIEVGSAYTTIFFVIVIPLLLLMQSLGKPRKPKKTSST